MATARVHCIYCRTSVDHTKGQGDHVVPAALGNFRDDLRFRRICRQCNTRIGRCEEQLIRCAPESVFLRVLKPATTRDYRGKRGWPGAGGAPPPRAVRLRGDYGESVRISLDDAKNIEQVDHIDVIDKKGVMKSVRLVPEMNGEQLLARVTALNLGPIGSILIYCDSRRWDRYVELTREAWPRSTMKEGETTEPGFRRVPIRIEFCVTKAYWQAVAKVAFHYFLVTTARGYRGDEDDFRDVREFIMDGVGAPGHFFRPQMTPLNIPEALTDPAGVRREEWRHLLILDESWPRPRVGVYLFIGPDDRPPNAHHFEVGRFRSNLVAPGVKGAHVYHYFAEPDDEGFAGRVAPVELR